MVPTLDPPLLSVQEGLCPGSVSVWGVSVQGVSVQGGLCPGGLCPVGGSLSSGGVGHCPGGVSVGRGGHCLGVSVQGISVQGVSVGRTPNQKRRCYTSYWNVFLFHFNFLSCLKMANQRSDMNKKLLHFC